LRKLEARQFDSATAQSVADYCLQQGWQSDQRFAEAYLRFRSQKGYGPRRINAELRERGVDPAVISAAMKEADVDWAELAESQLCKRLKASSGNDAKEKARQQRFLLYRGFETNQLQPLLRRYF